MENRIIIPTSFSVQLPNKNELFYNQNNKKKIWNLLFEASNGYCMYCGKNLVVETDVGAHLEHSVDKEGNEGQHTKENDRKKWKYLKHCKYNFSLVCPNCNLVCKKQVEKLNLLDYPEQIECKKIDCSSTYCDIYEKLRNDYMRKNAIILQPQGLKNEKVQYQIMYDLIKHIFIPVITLVPQTEVDSETYDYEYNKGIFFCTKSY